MGAVSNFFDLSNSPILNAFKSKAVMNAQPQAYHGGGGYFGGGGGGSKWPNGLSTSSPVLHLDHYRLRQQARVAMQDSPEGRAIVERKTDSIAHTGLKFEPTPDAGVLGITQQEAAEWSKNVASRFDLWANDKRQHRSETMTFYQAQWLYTYFKERDNDVFVRLYYSTDKSLQNPLQFEFLDPDQIRGNAYTISYGMTLNNYDGIIRDKRNREVGYKIWVKDEKGIAQAVEIKAKGKNSGRIFMLHGFSTEYAGQGRGFTKLAPIIQELQNLTDFKLAHIKMAINQAMINGWIVPSKDEDANPIFDANLTNGGAGAYVPETQATDCEDATQPVVGDFECHSIPEATFNNPSVFLQNLSAGSDIKFGNPNAPVASYDKFTSSFETTLAALSGVPLEVVHMKFGSNYAANRATLLLHQRIVDIQRDDQAADLNNPIVKMWMSGEIASGRISAPGWSDPRLRAAWMKGTWRGPSIPDIDPAKLARAYRDHIEMGTDSAERISQLHSGKSAAENIEMNNRSYEDYEVLPFSENAALLIDDDENSDGED